MNDFEIGLATLSAAVYKYGVNLSNRIANENILSGLNAVELLHTAPSSSGFEASAYSYDGKIVIAFAGTNTDEWQDIWADIGIGLLGSLNAQVIEAAKFYLDIKAQYGDNIVFTGHSLGGGLASLMAVFFNRPATTFDEAPFRLAATQKNLRLQLVH